MIILFLLGCSSTQQKWDGHSYIDDNRPLPIILTKTYAIDTTEVIIKPPSPNDTIQVTEYPEVLKRVAPIYPDDKLRNNIECDVLMRALISSRGNVVKALIIKTDDSDFNTYSLHAIMQWKFSPGMINKRPVDLWLTVPMRFRMNIKH
jgi:TonB family protein